MKAERSGKGKNWPIIKNKLTIKYNGAKIVRDEFNNPLYYDETKAEDEMLPSKIVTVDYSALQITASEMREVAE